MLENENHSSGFNLEEPNLPMHILEEKVISNFSKVDNNVMYATANDNIDLLDVETKSHDKINTKDMSSDNQKEGGGKRAICRDCLFEPRPGQVDNLFEVHAECRPKCPFVIKKKNAGQTNLKEVATPTVPAREPRVDSTRQMVARTRQASPEERKNKLLCQMCTTHSRKIVFTPCGHSSCETCAEGVEECMKCHKPIERKIDFIREKPAPLLKLEVQPLPETMLENIYCLSDFMSEEPIIAREPDPSPLFLGAKDNIDELYVEAKSHDKINTEDTSADDQQEEITSSNYPKVDDIIMSALTKDNDDVLDVEAQNHDKINTEDTPMDDKKEDEDSKWKECIQTKDVKAARKMLDDGKLPSPEELQFAVNNFYYSNETREIVKDICQRIEMVLLEEHEGIEYVKGSFKHDDPSKNVIFVIKTSKPTTVRSLYHWYVLEQNNEEALKEMECENSTENQSEERFQKACECLRIKSPDFMEAHSNLTSTSVSPVKLRRLQAPEKAVCIVFYVEAKGYIPIGENILPEQIKYDDDTPFVTDVREGQCATAIAGPCDKHEDLKIGCQIESANVTGRGTLGCFVNHPTNGLCAISCAHVLLNIKEFEEVYKKTQNVESLRTIQCFQPKQPELCGEICDIRLFNKNKNYCGMDIALFKVDEERKPKTTAFPDVLAADVVGIHSTLINDLLSTKLRYNPRYVMQNSMNMGKFTQVVKYGSESKFTSGKYHCFGTSVTLKLYGHITDTMRGKIFKYILADQIVIKDYCGEFCKPGDSGAMVFVIDENKDLIALGILTGRDDKAKTTCVTPIWNILEEIEMPLPYVLAEPSKAHAIVEELKRSIVNHCEALTSILDQ